MGARALAFMNQKGGVGKTTTVAAVGSLLAAEHGYRVLLVDLDPQCNLSDHFGVDQAVLERSVFNVLIDGDDPYSIIHRRHGIDLLPSSIDLGGAELLLASMMMRELRLKNSLAPLMDDYDYVLLDCPPSLGLLTISGLALAHGVMIPMQAEFLALRGLAQLMRTIEVVRDHLNPALAVQGVVFCMYDPRTNLAKDVRAEVERHFPDQVYAANVRKNIRLAEAPSHGLPINLYDPTCSGAADYREVVAEFLRREPGRAAAATPAPVAAPLVAPSSSSRPPRAGDDGGVSPAVEGAEGVAAQINAYGGEAPFAPSAAAVPAVESPDPRQAAENLQRRPFWRGDVTPPPKPPPADTDDHAATPPSPGEGVGGN